MQRNDQLRHWLRQRRKSLDLTQAELAYQVGCALVTIKKIERGVQRPSKQMAERLAQVLDVEPAAFVSFARGQTVTPPGVPSAGALVSHTYLAQLERQLSERLLHRFVELSGDSVVPERLPRNLTDDFGPLTGFNDYDDFFQKLSAPIEADHTWAHDQVTEYVPNVRERLMQLERTVLLGEPGAGKTWMLYRVALAFAGTGQSEPTMQRIPILVPLNLYQGGAFMDFVRMRAGALGNYLDELIRDGQVILLCDALNEMPKAGLEQVCQVLAEVKYFIVSCRVRDYVDDLQPLHPLEQVVLRNMGLDAIQDFIQRRLPAPQNDNLWQKMGGSADLLSFWQKVRQNGDENCFWDERADVPIYTDSAKEDPAWRQMHSGARLIPMARNPFMAQILCAIYEREGSLPSNRAALFERFIVSLIERESKNAQRQRTAFPGRIEIEALLVELARALQERHLTSLDHATVSNMLKIDNAKVLLTAATDANILVDDGISYKFAHQLLQEYFAVRILLESFPDGDPTPFFENDWWNAGVWRETFIILGEFLGERELGANRVAQWLAPVNPEIGIEVVTRNANGLNLSDIAEETRDALMTIAISKTRETDIRGRASAYRALGLLEADRRQGISLIQEGTDAGLPDIEWVKIPAGEFSYQDGTGEIPYDYWMARFPLTTAQYGAFLNATDGGEDVWWEGLPEGQNKAHQGPSGYANHPRADVTWYQALAFCRWLSYSLSGELPNRHLNMGLIRLPTEYEWEKAARANTGWQYPYGNDFDPHKGNTSATGIRQTCAVGMFPEGASAYGVLDMGGNVREWCLNDYTDPNGLNIAINDANKALRGTTFYFPPKTARAFARNYSNPFFHDAGIGVRLLRLS
jgi:formylglycine-generating enzyme required for sulfatase activity/transcriptional regulator with XRE-family HTH domain